MNKEFWKNKRVLITGHTGFKGSWLSLWLQHLGAHIVGYSLPPPTTPSMYEVARVSEDMTNIQGDIRDLAHLRDSIAEFRPEIVVHMAAQSLVRYSYEDPMETYTTNIIGTANVLEAVRQVGNVKIIVVVTSDKCYENREWLWGYREGDTLGGFDPYSSSKACAEIVTAAYRNSFFNENDVSSHGVAVVSVRAGNVIGGGDWSQDRLIPDITKAFMQNSPVVIRNPHSIRPWQHVLEPIRGYLCLMEHLWNDGQQFIGGWNFGPEDNDAKPVSWIVDRMAKLWGKDGLWSLNENGDHPHEARYLKLDCSKAKSLIGWKPALNIAAALQRTVNWYRNYEAQKDMREYSIAELDQYFLEMQLSKSETERACDRT
jgi:CDP-glucose 4,6-dehydratase